MKNDGESKFPEATGILTEGDKVAFNISAERIGELLKKDFEAMMTKPSPAGSVTVTSAARAALERNVRMPRVIGNERRAGARTSVPPRGAAERGVPQCQCIRAHFASNGCKKGSGFSSLGAEVGLCPSRFHEPH